MSNRSKRRRPAGAGETTARSPFARTPLVIAAALVALLAAGWWVARPARTGLHPEGAAGTGPAAAAAPAPVDLAIVAGRWQRLEGGYILDIARVQADGTMTAAYLNPRSINVSVARASRSGNAIEVFVELRDVNYPGATYRLTYDAVNDRLAGVYHQPALQETFDVVFVRATP